MPGANQGSDRTAAECGFGPGQPPRPRNEFGIHEDPNTGFGLSCQLDEAEEGDNEPYHRYGGGWEAGSAVSRPVEGGERGGNEQVIRFDPPPQGSIEEAMEETPGRQRQGIERRRRPRMTTVGSPTVEVLHGGEASGSMTHFVARYLATGVYGVQSTNTLRAKAQDLAAFAGWFRHVNGHAEVTDWMPRDTQTYLAGLQAAGKSPATVNRIFSSIRHFARWVHAQPGSLFVRHGMPTRGVNELYLEEATCKKFSRLDMHRILRAADGLVNTSTHGKQRPRRARALLAVLYHTGLRISELLAARMEQYDGRYLIAVKRKGRGWTNKVYLAHGARVALDDYIATERVRDTGRFATSILFVAERTGMPWASNRAREALRRIGQEAGKHRGKAIDLRPHRLRNTFAAEYRDKTGSDTETARALGHTSLQYVGRYARKTDTEREAAIDEIFRDTTET